MQDPETHLKILEAEQAEFDRDWPVSRIENLTLEEYTNRDKTSFIYAVEFGTRKLGGIRGGSSLKFMMYARADQKTEPPLASWSTDGQYAWASELGRSPDEAFAKVKVGLVELVRAAVAGDLETIDRNNLYGDTVKWKIASLYNVNGVFPVFQLKMAQNHLAIAQPGQPKPQNLLEAQRRYLEVLPEGRHPNLLAAELQSRYEATVNKAMGSDEPNPDPETFMYNGDPFEPEKFKGTYWILKTGQDARHWRQFQDEEIGGMGYPNWPDLSEYESREAITADIPVREPAWSGNNYNHTRALWEFSHEIKEGDIIIAAVARHSYLGVGIVTSGYAFEESEASDALNHIVGVNWVRVGKWAVRPGFPLALKTLLNISQMENERDEFWPRRMLTQIFNNLPSDAPDVVNAWKGNVGERGEADLVYFEDSFLERSLIQGILTALRVRKNVILQGPPGTGKTFIARRLAYALMGGKHDDRITTVQFHQSYSYEDFIQGFRPSEDKGFERRDGVFFRFCERARKHPELDHFFIIDEINRGNLSKIFGELMMLIEADKRGPEHQVELTYSAEGEQFNIPANVHMIGTMNTADRSLAMVDYALRRRFAFFDIQPAFNGRLRDHLLKNVSAGMADRIIGRLSALNAVIRDDGNLGEGFEVGHSYFCHAPAGDEEAWYQHIIKHEVGPQLREYWFDDRAKAEAEIAKLKSRD